jgi:hypothetical protein
MADDLSVKYSAGFVEGWIEKVLALHPDLANGDVALDHLQIIVNAYDEHRRNIGVFRNVIRQIKDNVNTGANL